MIMDESEVFKTNHSEKALNVDENIAKTNVSKRKGPILENRLSQFESRNLEDFSRGSAIIGQLNDDFSKIPEIIKKNGGIIHLNQINTRIRFLIFQLNKKSPMAFHRAF